MIRKLVIASLLLCAVALAQPPQGGPRPGGPGFDGPHQNFGPHPGGEMHSLLPPGRWWKDTEVAKNIGLSDVQVQKIEQVFQDSRVRLVDIHANLQKEELKLEPLLEADNPDENAVLTAIDHITAARANLEKANAQMAFSVRRVLTPEQWKKLRALRPTREHFPSPMNGPHANFQHKEHMPPPPPGPGDQSTPPAPEKDDAQTSK